MCEIFKSKVLHHRSFNVYLKDWKWKETVLKNTQFSLWCQKKSSNRWKLVCTIRCEPTVELKLRDNLPSCSFYVNTRQMRQISDFNELDMCNGIRGNLPLCSFHLNTRQLWCDKIISDFGRLHVNIPQTQHVQHTVIYVKIGFSATRKFLGVTR